MSGDYKNRDKKSELSDYSIIDVSSEQLTVQEDMLLNEGMREIL